MKYQSPKSRTENLEQDRPANCRGRNCVTYDRHIRKINKQTYQFRSVSPASSTSSSYHSELQESLLKQKPVRQYAIQKKQKRQPKQHAGSTVRRMTQPVRNFKINGLTDNFYSQLLDWSYNNFLCVGCKDSLSFYNMALQPERQERQTCTRRYRVECGYQRLNSLHFSPINTRIALGYSQGSLLCYDYYKGDTCFVRHSHMDRISCIEWYGNVIYTGSKDRKLRAVDCRSGDPSAVFPQDHFQEICGVKTYSNYLATGGNDNWVYIYDLRKTSQFMSHYSHEAAVKALDWVIPNTLVSGGGNGDRKIKFWKDGQGIVKQIDTGSQVCGIIASTNSPEILSCQGFSLNQVIIWNMEGKRELTVHGHQKRVLYCALSPGGQFVATGAGDQRLKVWKFFESGRYRDWSMSDIR